MTRKNWKLCAKVNENIAKSTKRKSARKRKKGTENAKKRRVRQVKVLEYPDITRALRTGYPYIKPVPPADPVTIVNDEEFAKIVATRKKSGSDDKRHS